MRGLTIKREKSFVGCLMKSRIYVCDEHLGDTKINGDKCYKLGELKNGEEKCFPIGDEETKIYVIQDKLSKNMCNEVCYIPAGIENIYLIGECKYNPFGGNNFRFHGMTDPRVLANRKKTSKKFGVFLVLCIIIGFVAGFFGNYDTPDLGKDGNPVEIVDDAGVKMTLTDSFVDTDIDGFDFAYGSDDAVVFGREDEFSLIEGLENYTLEKYGELSIKNSKLDSTVKKENGITYFEYQSYDENTATNYCYFAAIYKTEHSFWTITFAVDEAHYEEYKNLFFEWANCVQFIEE